MEIWEPKPPGTLWATPGSYGTPLPLLQHNEPFGLGVKLHVHVVTVRLMFSPISTTYLDFFVVKSFVCVLRIKICTNRHQAFLGPCVLCFTICVTYLTYLLAGLHVPLW